MFEKVNPAHPDKIADRIAGAIVDLAYNESANPKIAVEVLIGHGMCNIAAESSVHISATDILEAVSRIAGDVVVNYHEVAQDPILARNQANAVRCGDNGIFRGVPVTDEQRALAEIAREIFARYPSMVNTFSTVTGSSSVKAARTPKTCKISSPARRSTRSATGQVASMWTPARPTESSAAIWQTVLRAEAFMGKTSRRQMSA